MEKTVDKVEKLQEELKNLVSEITERESQEIGLDAKFVEDLGMDSMMALEILASIEKKYKIVIPEESLTKITTLAETVKLVQNALAKKK